MLNLPKLLIAFTFVLLSKNVLTAEQSPAASACFTNFESQKYKESLPFCKEIANQGDALAQFYLGGIYARGAGTPKDFEKAFYWYLKAAEQGFARAQLIVGLYFNDGQGTSQDYDKALFWLLKSAEQNYAGAQTMLGAIYYHGVGRNKDYQEAFKWYQQAAKNGALDSQSILGNMYKDGTGVPKNLVLAYVWWNIAAAQGDQKAINNRDYAESQINSEQIAEAQALSNEYFAKYVK